MTTEPTTANRIDGSYLVVTKGTVAKTLQVAPWLQFDVDTNGNLLGIERIGGNVDMADLLAAVVAMTPVLVAARQWRTLAAGSILGTHERPLAVAVDHFADESGELP